MTIEGLELLLLPIHEHNIEDENTYVNLQQHLSCEPIMLIKYS